MLVSGVTTIVECGPGKVLTSLNKRVERRPDLKVLIAGDPRFWQELFTSMPGVEVSVAEPVTRTVAAAVRVDVEASTAPPLTELAFKFGRQADLGRRRRRRRQADAASPRLVFRVGNG